MRRWARPSSLPPGCVRVDLATPSRPPPLLGSTPSLSSLWQPSCEKHCELLEFTFRFQDSAVRQRSRTGWRARQGTGLEQGHR